MTLSLKTNLIFFFEERFRLFSRDWAPPPPFLHAPALVTHETFSAHCHSYSLFGPFKKYSTNKQPPLRFVEMFTDVCK